MKNRYSMSCVLVTLMFISFSLFAQQSTLSISNIPLDLTIECSESPSMITPIASSDCPDGDAAIVFEEAETESQCFNNYTITRTWTATDPCGNSEVITQSILVQDRTAPVLESVVLNLYVNCGNIPPMTNLQSTDNCDGDIDLNLIEFTNNTNCSDGYIITRIWEATDDCGNKSTQSQFVHVEAAPLSTSTEEIEKDQLAELVEVFPNPSSDQMFVKIDNRLDASRINLFDTNGQLVKTVVDKMNMSSIDLTELSPGFYWLQLRTDRGLVNKRITVIRS